MKKIAFIVIALLIGFGFAVNAAPVKAAETAVITANNTVEISLSAQDAAKLQQNLENLKAVTAELKSRLSSSQEPVQNSDEIMLNLLKINANLLSIAYSLESSSGQSQPLAVKPSPTELNPSALSQKELSQNSAPAQEVAPAQEPDNSKEAASVAASINWKKIPWPTVAIIILFIVAVVWFLRTRADEDSVQPTK